MPGVADVVRGEAAGVLAVPGSAAPAHGATLGQDKFQDAQVVLGQPEQVLIDIRVVRMLPDNDVVPLPALLYQGFHRSLQPSSLT